MKVSSLSYFLILCLINLTTSSPLNPSEPSPHPLSLVSHRYYKCADYSLASIIFQDCANAFLQIPSSHTPGRFHPGPREELFGLPFHTTYLTCGVTIELGSGQWHEELANWQGVGVAAMMLNDACMKYSKNQGLWHNGGWVTAGENLRLRITLWRVKNGAAMGQKANGTYEREDS